MMRLVLIAALALLAGCVTFDSYDRGACLVVLADGSSALRYPGEAGCWS